MADPPPPPGFMPYSPPSLPPGFVPMSNDPLVDPNTGQYITRAPGGTNTPGTDFLYGTRQPIDNAAILSGRALEGAVDIVGAPSGWASGMRASAQESAKEALKRYSEIHGGPPDDSSFRQLGNMVVPTALGYAMPGAASQRFIPRTLSNATTGGLTSLLLGDPNATPEQLANTALGGAGVGAGASMATGALASTVAPQASMAGSDVRRLMDLGVRPTPGQIKGGAIGGFEQGVANVYPFAGDIVKEARRRAVVQLNQGIVNDVLSPLNVTLPKGVEGFPALKFMTNETRDAYTRAVPAAGATLDPTAIAELNALKNSLLPSDPKYAELQGYINKYIDSQANKVSPGSPVGHLTGQAFKDAEEGLGKEAAKFLHNHMSGPYERDLGEKLREAQTILRDNLERTDPATADAIRAANQAWSRYKVVEKAMQRPSADPGQMSAAQFQSAAYQNALSRQTRALGEAPYQAEGNAARRVLGATIPDSGTPRGQSVKDIVGGLLGLATGAGTVAGAVPPEVLAASVVGGGLLGAAYNDTSQRFLAHLMASRPAAMQALGAPIRSAAPAFTTGLLSGYLP